ncbi:S8 family serine peptidase [Sinomonas halotolerans]|uniref:S8 family serine peptidase n=1 Tax=Sinomonas halotolerans TaxID=1644133 RepID=A0ABU9X1N2_9MICC
MAKSRPADNSTHAPAGPVEVVVVTAHTGAGIHRSDVAESTAMEAELRSALPGGAQLTRSFGPANRLTERLQGTAQESVGTDLLSYFSVTGFSGSADELAEELAANDSVEAAFVKPPAEPPIAPDDSLEREAAAAPAEEAPPVTPDFSANQGYLEAAPGGINARWAWTRPGGRGQGVRVIDVEGAWRFTHEDLLLNQGGVIGGTQSTDLGWRNHGTAVAGEISADHNSIGVLGIAPDANIRAISIFGPGSAGAIRQAADALSAGDVILIELHRPGPRHSFQSRADQLGYIAVEWWPDDFAAIRYALGRGVIVVEAAGNGAENLDDALYDTRPSGFPSSWTNPFRGGAADSGAVVVGAGAPPVGTHGRDHGPGRSRLGFSNFGARVDAQGWGREVTTTGYGGLQGGPNEDLWYTDTFSGTSSASPIVVGAVACYQGISAAGSGRKTPAQVRSRLRSTGSPQTDAPDRPATQRIGNLPDLRALVGLIKVKDIKDGKAEKLEKVEIKEGKREKIEIKEGKLEKVEIKEGKREKLEKVEIKERDKIRDIDWGRIGGGGLGGFGGPQAEGPSAEDRLAALEGTVAELAHFIDQALRPDLGAGALGYDGLEDQSAQSKDEKDLKDAEKPAEG